MFLNGSNSLHRFLGHLYAAEALIKLNRLPEAIMHLSTENINNITITPPSGADPSAGSWTSYCFVFHFLLLVIIKANVIFEFYQVISGETADRDKESSKPHGKTNVKLVSCKTCRFCVVKYEILKCVGKLIIWKVKWHVIHITLLPVYVPEGSIL